MSQPNDTAAAQNILSLNDSTSPLVEQIEAASRILDIELQDTLNGPGSALRYPDHQGPREEWALRWLLKKLEVAEGGSLSVLLELKVWRLFGELIPRLPVTNLARLLRDHGFLNILQNTFKSLADAMVQHETPAQDRLQSLATRSSASSSEASSSSATISDPDMKGRRSKKRNRDGTNKMHSQVTPALDLGPVFCQLCGVLRQLQASAQDDSHGYAVEHLKMSLRAPTEQAANIFGRSLTVAYSLLLYDSRASLYLSAQKDLLRIVLTVMDDRENTFGELSGATDTLEDLLLQHIVVPTREIFHNAKTPRVARDDEMGEPNVDELLGPLQRLVPGVDTECQKTSSMLRPIVHLHSIIIKYTPLDKSKHRVSERAWLQFMFDRITTHASILVVPSPAATSALKEMLKTLLAKNLRLEIASLERILSFVSHLLGDKQDLVDWDIISLCLKMDPDVFVVPAVSPETILGKSARIPNQFLRALYDQSYFLTGSLRTPSPKIHQGVLEDVLIPLIDGFVHARDLAGFIEHWITSLECSRLHLWRTEQVVSQASNDIATEDGSLIDNGQTLWEHETLRQAVTGHIEARLTTGQIDTILQNAETILLDATYSADNVKHETILANVVIVDCVLGGCTSENTVAQLSRTVQKLYPTLLTIATSARLASSHPWRVWRCIASISNRWKAQLGKRPEICSMEEKAAWRALELLSHMGESQAVKIDDLLQSCNFMLSVLHNVTSPLREEYSERLIQSITNATRLYGDYVSASSSEAEHAGSRQAKTLQECLPFIIRETCSRPVALLQENVILDTRVVETQAFDSICRSPLYAFDNKQRSRIFNHVTKRLVDATSLTHQSTLDSLKPLINSMADPRKSMRLLVQSSGPIVASPDVTCEEILAAPTLFKIAFALAQQSDSSSVDAESLVLFKSLAQEVLNYQKSRHTGEQGDSYLTAYWINMMDTPKCASKDVFVTALIDITMGFYKSHFADFEQTLQILLFDVFLLWLKRTFDLSNLTIDQLDCEVDKVQTFVSISSSYQELLLSTRDDVLLTRFTTSLKDLLKNFSTSKAQGAVTHAISNSMHEQTLHLMQEKQRPLESEDAIATLVDHHTSEGFQALVSNDTTANQSRDPKKRPMVPSASGPAQDPLQQQDLMEVAEQTDLNDEGGLLQLRRSVVGLAGNEWLHGETLSKPMGYIINGICFSLMQPQSYRVSVSQLRIIDTALRKHPRTITQWLMDQIMAVIATSASLSSASTDYTPKQRALQYLALCRIFSTILAFHRKRLGGRNHLILPVLQSLLRPLFIPFATAQSNPSASSPSDHAFTATHASAYSRLLSQLADPTLASLQSASHRRKEGNHNLNDPTKTAKSIAGQHLHYLISTYCSELLKGRLEPEVRKQLQVGIWKVLDVIPQETLRVMNAGMGKAERAVWKGIYGEWKRDGRHGGRREGRAMI
ncbi:MAG: hypothetical protein Q9202_005348 [Teloschistes flavicans]